MELALKTDKNYLQGAQDVFEIMQKIFFKRPKQKVDLHKEHFWTIALNRAHKILLIELVSIGTNGSTLTGPQEVFRLPLYKSASHLVLIHNHPSGNLKPSEADLDITNRLIQLGDRWDIEILDHVIVAPHCYYSFSDNGLIEKLRWDSKYALTFIRDKQLAKAKEEIRKNLEKDKKQLLQQGEQRGIEKGKEQGIKTTKKEIAKQMLAKNMDAKLVQELTGLTAQWIGRLQQELKEEKQKR